MSLQHPMVRQRFTGHRMLFLLGMGIGAGFVALVVTTFLLLAWGGAKPMGMALDGEAVAGETVTFELNVVNGGVLSQQYKAELLVDGKYVDEQAVTLKPKETVKVKLKASGLTAGVHTASVGSIKQEIRVLKPASFTVSDIAIQPKSPLSGTDVTVTAIVRNIGEAKGDYTPDFLLDGNHITAERISIGPGGEQNVSVILKAVEQGSHTVSLGDASQTFSALMPAHITVRDMNLSSSYAPPGGKVAVLMHLNNSGDVGGNYDLHVEVNGSVVADKTIYIDGGAEVSYTYNFSADKEGKYQIQAGTLSLTVEVVPISRPETGTLLVNTASGEYCTLSVKNQYSDRDIIIILVSESDPNTVLMGIYVRAGESTKKIKVKNGNYSMSCYSGTVYASTIGTFLTNPQTVELKDKLVCTTYNTRDVKNKIWEDPRYGTVDGTVDILVTHYLDYTLTLKPDDSTQLQKANKESRAETTFYD